MASDVIKATSVKALTSKAVRASLDVLFSKNNWHVCQKSQNQS
jgi:hypothetical protein